MTKLFMIVLIIFVCFSVIGCSKDTTNIIETKKADETIVNTPEDTSSVKEDETLPQKPKSAIEIIQLADSMNIDTSLTGFTLDGILENTQLSLTEDSGEAYQNETAYLGDSVSLGLGVFGNHPKELVIAKGSINPLDAVIKQLIELEEGTFVNFPDALSRVNPKRAVLTFGANAISIMSEETFLNYYIKLIDEVKEKNPECEIIIQSISPIATTCTLKKFTNVLINRANLLLLILAYSEDIHFLNSAPALKDENGYLKLEYCSSDDGIHINEQGYTVWIDFLRTHALISE